MHNFRMWIEREFAPSITRMGRQFPAVLVTGPRQVGKTSLLKYLLPKASYVSFDLPSLARQAEENPKAFLSSFEEPALLDEVQYVPSLFRHLKIAIDQNKKPGRFFLTGSQSFTLMQGISESLAGRCGILEMHSLSLDEVLLSFPDFFDGDYIVQGGFPETYTGRFENISDWYSSYLATYLERDVRNIRNVGDLRDFERLLRALALRTGQLLSYSELAKDVGIAPNTAKQWVSVLLASGQIFLLEPYYRNLGKRLIKSPKVYFLDTGLASYLVGLDSWKSLLHSPLVGAFWETHIVGQVIRHFHAKAKRPPIWFWQTAYGEAMDILIEEGGRFSAIECKLNENPGKESLKGFRALQKFYGDKVLIRGLVACRTEHPFPLDKNIKAIHGRLLTKELA